MIRKLLVDCPDGSQQLITVAAGGGYFDLTMVLWDEGTDGPIPDGITIGGMVRVGSALEYSEQRFSQHEQALSVPVVPRSITPRQGKIILSRYGLLADVQTALDAMTGQEGEEARIDFAAAQEWKRDWPLLLSMATLLGLSSAQIDQMFIEAATI